jgi:hypothetical protein
MIPAAAVRRINVLGWVDALARCSFFRRAPAMSSTPPVGAVQAWAGPGTIANHPFHVGSKAMFGVLFGGGSASDGLRKRLNEMPEMRQRPGTGEA